MSIKLANGSEITPIEIGENHRGTVRGLILTEKETRELLYQEDKPEDKIDLDELLKPICNVNSFNKLPDRLSYLLDEE